MQSLFSRHLRFASFRYDPQTRVLSTRGKRVALRAKAAEVLHVLVHAADQIVSKDELRERVWGREAVSDQSLFQAISDVRRALAPLEAIVTHPNQGYRWALPVRRTRRSALALAAGLMPLVVVGVWMLAGFTDQPARAPAFGSLSPTMQAFANGVALLGAGDAAQAQRKLQLVLSEDATFVEARLMLGEAYLAQGQPQHALAEARRVLHSNEALRDPDVHTAVAAMALISRAEDTSGSAARALHWAFEAAQRAHQGGLVCTASNIEDRIDELLAHSPAPSATDPLHPPVSSVSRMARDADRARRAPPPAFCAEFDAGPLDPEARMRNNGCRFAPAGPRVAALPIPFKTSV